MQAWASYTPAFGGCLRSIPLIVVLDVRPLLRSSVWNRTQKIPRELFDFDTPYAPPPPPPFLGGGGVKTSVRIAAAVCGFGPGSCAAFFLCMDPLTHCGGPGPKLRVPPSAPLWALAGGCLVAPEKFSKFDFFRNPSVAPRMGLGDHLVTIRVL